MVIVRDAAALLGTELRRARLSARQRQRDVAAEIGCSQSTISRMELGLGGRVPLALWSAAAMAVDRRLSVELLQPRGVEGNARNVTLRVHRTLAEEARQGGWSAVTVVERHLDREVVETVLDRGPERVVVHVWDVVAAVPERLAALKQGMEREQAGAGAGLVGGLVIVPTRAGNRRRMTEARGHLEPTLPTLAADWFRAIRNPAREMPRAPGVLWSDRNGARLLPAPLVPGWAWIAPDRGSRALT
jgi:transcriptional regulator with XRE-family HTH domain